MIYYTKKNFKILITASYSSSLICKIKFQKDIKKEKERKEMKTVKKKSKNLSVMSSSAKPTPTSASDDLFTIINHHRQYLRFMFVIKTVKKKKVKNEK